LVEGDTVSAIDELARYIAVGRVEQKVIQAEKLLTTLSGLPSIESPVEKQIPKNIDNEEIPAEGKIVFYIIGVLLVIISALSWYLFRNRAESAYFSENNPVIKNRKLEPSPLTKNEDIELPVDREIESGGDRWLKTDKDTIAEVDRLMDKFGELEEGEKKIDSKIANVMKNINKKE